MPAANPNPWDMTVQFRKRPPALSAAAAERFQRFGSKRVRSSSAPVCDVCANVIEESHGHLVDVPRQALLCVCRPCYLLFTHEKAGTRFRAVPTRFALVADIASATEVLDALDVPIGLAFFFRNSVTGRTTAFYPSPAGATESELPLESWDALAGAAPLLATLAADVEALLVRRTSSGLTALIVPLDVCYELVGVMRVSWKGLQDGDALWRDVDEFFAGAVEQAKAEQSAEKTV